MTRNNLITHTLNIILVSAMVLFLGYLPATAACQTGGNGSQSALTEGQLGDNLPRIGCGDDTSFIADIMKAVFGGLAVIAVVFIVIGGLRYTLSGGDANAVASAKKTILYAVLGLVLGVLVFFITSFITSVVG